jgi:hypothetical protein
MRIVGIAETPGFSLMIATLGINGAADPGKEFANDG